MARIEIIPGQPEHRALVLDAFSKAYARTAHAQGVYPRVLLPKMEALLNNELWSTLVATPEGMSSEALGFVVFNKRRRQLAWIHVKKAFRRQKIGTALFYAAEIADGGNEIACPFVTPEAVRIATKYNFVLRFRPYIPDSLILAADDAFENAVSEVINGEA